MGLCPLCAVDSEQQQVVEGIPKVRRKIQDADDDYTILVLLPLGADRVGCLSRTMWAVRVEVDDGW